MKLDSFMGYDIQVEQDGTFEARDEGVFIFSAKTLEELKNKIKTQEKKVLDAKGIYAENYGYEDVKITSIVEEKSNFSNSVSYEAWISFIKYPRSRRKVGLYSIIKDTPENRQLLKEIEDLEIKKSELQEQKNKLQEKIEKYKPSDFGYGG